MEGAVPSISTVPPLLDLISTLTLTVAGTGGSALQPQPASTGFAANSTAAISGSTSARASNTREILADFLPILFSLPSQPASCLHRCRPSAGTLLPHLNQINYSVFLSCQQHVIPCNWNCRRKEGWYGTYPLSVILFQGCLCYIAWLRRIYAREISNG